MAVGDKIYNPRKIKKAAFGSTQERFNRFFLHPGLDKVGIFQSKEPGCDPCLYSPKTISEAFEVNKDRCIEPWKYQAALMEWSKNLGYRNQTILDYKIKERRSLGPAWHDIPVMKKFNGSMCQNVGFGTVSRWKRFPNTLPGPGRYYNSNPYKVPYGPHNKLQSFDWSPPCRFPESGLKWSHAPNRYTVIDKQSIEQKPKKLVSKRGPYDLFTGKRDGSTIKNHFSDELKCSAATWPLNLKGSMERFKKTRLGVMNKSGRDQRPSCRTVLVDTAMCYKNPEEPGPAAYNLRRHIDWTQSYHPFNDSNMRPRGYRKVGVWPAVGRYTWNDPHIIPGHGHKHVFLSNIPRTMGSYLPEPMNSF